jgi:hypothetical protein
MKVNAHGSILLRRHTGPVRPRSKEHLNILGSEKGHLVPARFFFACMPSVAFGDLVDPVVERALVDGARLEFLYDEVERLKKLFFYPS